MHENRENISYGSYSVIPNSVGIIHFGSLYTNNVSVEKEMVSKKKTFSWNERTISKSILTRYFTLKSNLGICWPPPYIHRLQIMGIPTTVVLWFNSRFMEKLVAVNGQTFHDSVPQNIAFAHCLQLIMHFLDPILYIFPPKAANVRETSWL